MPIKSLSKLIALSAIWGSSFIFMRIIAPAIGPISTSFSRLFIAGIFFIIYYLITSTKGDLKQNFKIIALVALVNTAIPFTLYAVAALYIPAAISSIINSMAPMFGMIFSILILKQKASLRGFLGILLGVAGVSLITGGGAISFSLESFYGILACLIAAMCYGLASVIIRRYATNVKPIIMAGYSQFFASLYLIPILPFQNVQISLNTTVVVSILLLALMCSAVAYLLYYNLVVEIGPTKTLTVTFLMPIFSIIWGLLFLQEAVYPITIIGMLVVLLGTRLVLTQK